MTMDLIKDSEKLVSISSARLARVMDVLSLTSIGRFDHERSIIKSIEQDDFGLLEETLNILTQEIAETRRENERVVGELRRSEMQLKERLALIEKQQRSIQELSSPVLEISDRVLVLPVIGAVDRARAEAMTSALLTGINERGAYAVIVDVTGAATFDTTAADYFIKLTRAATLLGARSVFTGISPENAVTLVTLGVDFGNIQTFATLKDGLRNCLERGTATSRS